MDNIVARAIRSALRSDAQKSHDAANRHKANLARAAQALADEWVDSHHPLTCMPSHGLAGMIYTTDDSAIKVALFGDGSRMVRYHPSQAVCERYDIKDQSYHVDQLTAGDPRCCRRVGEIDAEIHQMCDHPKRRAAG